MSTSPPRSPNFKRLLITGITLGIIVGVAVSFMGEQVRGYSTSTAALYLGAFGAAVGAAVAGLLGILLDRSSRHRGSGT